MKHLILISLGPVQDFIASARQCQDLWYGSWLLSELSAAVAMVLRDDPRDSTLIFPADINATQQENGVANKILSILHGDQEDVKQVTQQAEEAMLKKLREISFQAYNKVAKKHFHRDVAEAQLEDLMEFLWVAVPLSSNSAEAYANARQQAEQLLAMRKNSKNWTQPSWLQLQAAQGVPKSSLDGIRESVLNEAIYPARGQHRQHALTDQQRRTQYFVKGAERLCGVGLLKRIGTDPKNKELFGSRSRPNFHSTSHMAAAKVVSKVNQHPNEVIQFIDGLEALGLDLARFRLLLPKNFQNAYEVSDPYNPEYMGGFTKCLEYRSNSNQQVVYYDGSLLFEQRVYAECKEQLGKTQARQIQKQMTKLLNNLRERTNTKEPYPYYAMILADGDKMGKALEVLAPYGLEGHQRVSQSLEGFTQQCRKIVDSHGGSLIYAGGDDVLALLPLHTAFQCARALHETFFDILKECFEGTLLEHCPTLSVGMAICHHLQPMGEMRELAKHAEKMAKVERNSLGVVFKKRGGSAIELSEMWSVQHQGRTFNERIWYWADLFKQNVIPHATAFMLADAIEPLTVQWDKLSTEEQHSVSNACQSLAAGVVDRRDIGGDMDVVQAHQAMLKSYFQTADNPVLQIQRLSVELQIAREMTTVIKESWSIEGEQA